MTNEAKKVNEKIDKFLEARSKELLEINLKSDEYKRSAENAAVAMKEATEKINPADYIAAEKQKREAEVAVEMYRKRYEQYERKDIVSEEESDRILDGLSKYESDLADEFKAAVADPIRKLTEIYNNYVEKVEETERVIDRWTRDIRANRRNPGAFYKDTGSDKAPYDVKYRSYGYWTPSAQIKTFIEEMGGVFDNES